MEWWNAIAPVAAVLIVAFISPFVFDTPRRRARARLRSDAEALSHMDPGPGRDELSAHVDQQARELVARDRAKGKDGAREVVALTLLLGWGIVGIAYYGLPVSEDESPVVRTWGVVVAALVLVMSVVFLITVVPQVRKRRRPK